jgi:hypothetical protein
MPLDNYTNLKAEIANYLDRPDLSSEIDMFIDLAEVKHKRTVRIRELVKRAQASTSTGTRYLALPTGFLEMRTMRLIAPVERMLRFVNEHEMNRLISSASGVPEYFTVHEEIEFERASDSVYTAEMIYYAAVDPLSDDSEAELTNAILTNHPDLYLYGALVEAEPFIDNDERVAMWKTKYDEVHEQIRDLERRRRVVGPLVSRPAGDTP